MSQVQNSTLHNFVQPAFFLGVALLAGRAIEKFPGASKGGLFLSATLGSGIALASQKYAAEDESAWHSFARVTASLALGTILAPYAAKTLNGRADITMPAALRFGLVETVIAMGLAVVSNFISSDTDDKLAEDVLLKKNHKSCNVSEDWKALTNERRTELVKQFYKADLSSVSLEDAMIAEDALNAFRDFPQMTANQLGWHVQMLMHVVDYSNEDLFSLNLALHAKGLPMNWGEGISQEQVDYAQDKPACVDLLHTYFTAHPIEFARIQVEEEDPVDFGEMFLGKDPIPELDAYLQSLDPAAIQQLCEEDVSFIIGSVDQNELAIEQQIAINVAANMHGINTLWIWPITEEIVAVVKTDDAACNWFHQEFTNSPVAYAAIEEDLREQLDAHFVTKALAPIADAAGILAELTAEDINGFEQPNTWDWRTYFEAFPNVWEAQSQEKATAFISAFVYNNLSLLPIDKVAIDFDQIWQPELDAVKELREHSTEWLLALEAKQEFLNKDVLAALQPQEEESDGSEDL